MPTLTAAAHNTKVHTGNFTAKNLLKGALGKVIDSHIAIYEQPKLPGARLTVSGTSVSYFAPSADQITEEEAKKGDSYSYTLKNSAGEVSLPAVVQVAIDWEASPTPTPPTNPTAPTPCVGSSNIICKGPFPESMSTTIRDEVIPAGATHVWSFVHRKAKQSTGTLMFFDGALKTISISRYPNDFSKEYPCQITQRSPEQPIWWVWEGTPDWYKCSLVDGETYYLNVKSTTDVLDHYALVLYADHPIEGIVIPKCSPSLKVICKPEIMNSHSILFQHIPFDFTHVYPFVYSNKMGGKGSFIVFDGELKKISISKFPNDFSLGFPCQITQQGLQHAIAFGKAGDTGFGECPLVEGQKYFLNIRCSQPNDGYTLTIRGGNY